MHIGGSRCTCVCVLCARVRAKCATRRAPHCLRMAEGNDIDIFYGDLAGEAFGGVCVYSLRAGAHLASASLRVC
jgi:hypothetical protein